mgnify:CR=1 FL=1
MRYNRHKSHVEEHFEQGTQRLHMPVFGRVCVFLLLCLLLSGGFAYLSFPKPGYFGLGVAVALEALFLLWKRQRGLKKRDEAIELQSELDALKRKEFELRYEEAKMSGKLDQWSKET